MVPIYYRAVPDDDIPETVAKFQRIDFTGTTDFDSNFAKVTKALDTDLDCKQTHTRLLTRAKEWERSGTDSSLLLRGKDLSEAEQRIVRSAKNEPKPTALHSQSPTGNLVEFGLACTTQYLWAFRTSTLSPTQVHLNGHPLQYPLHQFCEAKSRRSCEST